MHWNTYAKSDGDGDCHSYSNAYGYCNTDAQTDAYAEVSANAETASNAGAETITFSPQRKLSGCERSVLLCRRLRSDAPYLQA